MRRRVLALGSVGWGLAALGLFACSGDDTNPPLGDAGVPDATVTSDGSANDATSMADADAGAGDEGSGLDGGACIPYDAEALSDAEVQAGLKIVTARKCQECHGLQLQGNQDGLPSTNAEGGTAYPPDLTPDPVNGLGCWTNEEIAQAFLHGIDKEGQPLCNPMPRFGEEGDAGIDDAGAAAVVAYLRSIPIVVNPHVPKTPACYPPPPVDAGPDSGQDSGPAADAGDAAVADATVGDAAPDASDAAEDAAEDAGETDGGLDAD